MRALLKKIAVSPASTVLLTGESGTGKDLAAKVIHYSSSRASRPFMNITCSALPETLLESELFGHERGAFTGADRQKRGLIESADGGTVFLDEIGEMVPLLQAKLLRFLEEKSFKRVGGSVDIRVDVRVVAATNRSLQEEVKHGRFREDLFYRLNVMAVPLPPLRERRGGHPAVDQPLHRHLQSRVPQEDSRRHAGGAGGTRRYGWPGNVRELRNAVERAMLLGDGPDLAEAHFPMLTAVDTDLSTGMNLPAGGHQPGSTRTNTRGAGARTLGVESDQGGAAARPQSRPDSLPDRKVQSAEAFVGRWMVTAVPPDGRARDSDSPAMHFNQPLRRGHPQPGAPRLRGLEWAEEFGTNFRRDARALVDHLNPMPAGLVASLTSMVPRPCIAWAELINRF